MKNIIITLAAILLSLICKAQTIDDFFKKSALQTTVENSIKPGLFVIRQNFILREKNTGEYFTRNNAAEFSYTYSLAVKTTNGYYITEIATEPWKYDDNFKKLSKPEKFTPVIFKTLISPIREKACYTKLDTGKIKSVRNNKKLFIISDTSAKTGFELFKDKKSEYFTIWVTVSDSADLYKTTAVKMLFHTATESEIATGTFDSPKTADRIIGGIVMVTDCSNVGTVKFQLAGLLTPNGENWETEMLPVSKNSTTETDGSLELTPINTNSADENETPKNKKKKK